MAVSVNALYSQKNESLSDDLLKFKTKKPISRTIKEVVWKRDYLKN